MRSRGELYQDAESCAERGKWHAQALYLSVGFSDCGMGDSCSVGKKKS
jgi:hypothetical protein